VALPPAAALLPGAPGDISPESTRAANSADPHLLGRFDQRGIGTNRGVGGIPVLDQDRECAGILTERDIVVRVLAEEREPLAAFVRDVATMHPVTCAPEEDVALVAERMRENEVQHLPVCQAGDVVGVISLADIVFRRPDEERGTIVPPRAVGR